MMTRRLLLMAVCLLALAGCGNFRDRASLGASPWTAERMEMGGQIQQMEPIEMTFSPTNNGVVIAVGDKVHKGVYELQSDRDPKEIDIKPDASNMEDKTTLHGIYAIDADSRGLLLCVSTKKRPKKFESRPDCDWVLIRLRRS